MRDLEAIRLSIQPEKHSYVVSRLNRIRDRDDDQFGLGSALVETLSDDNQRDDIADKIVTAASDNFLYAQLHITMLRHETDAGHLKRRLNNLPGTLTDLFKETMKRIEAEDERNDHKLERNTLSWAIYARRPLIVAELSHALAMSSVKRSRRATILENLATIPSTQALIEATYYFLSIEMDTTTFHVHKAVKDYCEDSGTDIEERCFGDVQFKMAGICIYYLTLDNFKSGHCTSQSEWQDCVRRNPFFDYAACNWGWHVIRERQ